MPTKSKPATKNGRVMTAKFLPESSYNVIHKLPYGLRQEVLKKLIGLAVPFAKKHGVDWYTKVITGEAKIV
jgi:hypothetical protein